MVKCVHQSASNLHDIDTWLNVNVTLKKVDHALEQFSVRCFFNFFWMPSGNENWRKIENTAKMYTGCHVTFKGKKWVNLNSINDDEIRCLLTQTIPAPFLFDLDLMFPNSVCTPDVERANMFQLTDTVWLIELSVKAVFHETFEMEQFPLDFQFLNIHLNVGHRTKLRSAKPEWLDEAFNKVCPHVRALLYSTVCENLTFSTQKCIQYFHLWFVRCNV